MKIKSIELENVTKYAKANLELPDTGIVLLTGPNGAGKSTWIHAVGVGLWNKSLRGEPVWQKEQNGAINIFANLDLHVGRKHTSKNILDWSLAGNSQEFETTTKAQEALESVIGPFEVWHRTCVFSSQDISSFTIATDSERKKLLECLIGLDKFDKALEACKNQLRQVDAIKFELESKAKILKAKLDSTKSRVLDSQNLLEKLNNSADLDLASLEEESLEVSRQIADCDSKLSSLQLDLRQNERLDAMETQKVKDLEVKLVALRNKECAACGQDIPSALRDSFQEALDQERKKASLIRTMVCEHLKELENTHFNVVAERTGLLGKQQSYRAKLTEAKTNGLTIRNVQQNLALASAEVADLEDKINATEVEIRKTLKEYNILESCSKVLGLRGVRANILGKALAGIEFAANVWLAKLFEGNVSLSLKSYTEKKTGGVSDCISLEINGLGSSTYKGCSGGEKRRVDIALLFALAEAAQATYGVQTQSTLWFDECFDSLDKSGVEKVTEALEEIARARCVVVISHNETIKETLNYAKRVIISNGQLSME